MAKIKYKRISSFMPANIMKSYKQQMMYADKDGSSRRYVGIFMVISLIAAVAAFVLITLFLNLGFIMSLIIALLTICGVMVVSYVRIMLAADARAKKIEKVLPDALQLVSANIRAGMTIDRALWLCARPEFGPFEKELRKMASETIGGTPISESLMNVTKRVNSKSVDRAMRLLVQGIELGGELARLLTEISHDIRTEQGLQREINAATAMYTLFIIFAAVIAAPMLFSVSTFYVQTTGAMWEEHYKEPPSVSGGDIMALGTGGGDTITGEEMKLFALACITITTAFGALIIGMIKYGKAKRGIKYLPLFLMGGLSFYLIALEIISGMFGVISTM